MEFECVKLFRKRMEIQIPSGFVDMPDYIAKKKYPSKFRPPVILMSKDTLINYSFNLLEIPLPQDELVNATKGLYSNMKRNTPAGHFGEINVTGRENGQVAWFDYEAPTADDDIYGVIYVTGIAGKLMYGAFNCMLQEKATWEDVVIHSISSIKESGENED
ncbi:MAG: hypothetical protein J5988_14155 [Eubacterium sp.]|nr:hypothetical protein [Eubacterium sp.]